MQQVREVPDGGQRAFGNRPRVAQQIGGASAGEERTLGDRQFDFDGREHLSHLVVQLARDAAPLLLLRRDQLVRTNAEAPGHSQPLSPAGGGGGSRGGSHATWPTGRCQNWTTSAKPRISQSWRCVPPVHLRDAALLLHERTAIEGLYVLGDADHELDVSARSGSAAQFARAPATLGCRWRAPGASCAETRRSPAGDAPRVRARPTNPGRVRIAAAHD